jgi:1,4-alpha-glucan branching enzyme
MSGAEVIAMPTVLFTYATGLAEPLFGGAELLGSWDDAGQPVDDFSATAMVPIRFEDGCLAYQAAISFASSAVGHSFRWGVRLRRGADSDWGIIEELNDPHSRETVCLFTLTDAAEQRQLYRLNWSRHLGAQKLFSDDAASPTRISFAVWAPNAQAVEVVMADAWHGQDGTSVIEPQRLPAFQPTPAAAVCGTYVADDGAGAHPGWGPFPLVRHDDGVWRSNPEDPALAEFRRFEHAPYLYRVTRDDGSVVMRTDLYSRCQAGFGVQRPVGAYRGRALDLAGNVSASVVKDPDVVCRHFNEDVYPEQEWLPAHSAAGEECFWPSPSSLPPRPQRLQDLVIYELHVGALGFGCRQADEPGTLADAIAFLDHLVALGVNAVELLPLAESGGGGAGWGYATSHYFAIEYAGGGRDKYKHFIRACHQRGIAVILDVVFNHYNHNAERAQWQFDSTAHERNIYYWYEGHPSDYASFDAVVPPERRGHGGYVDNMSTAWAPRYWEPMVRRLFISSLLALVSEFQIDGFRFDQTTSIHAYNQRHADGEVVNGANIFGQKLLREACRALRLIKPGVLLMAEDHSSWPAVTTPLQQGGLGFDARWFADFYHHLIGDTDKDSSYARLLHTAGLGDDRPLAMGRFADVLAASGDGQVVYHESHDEAGNAAGTDRTINVAVNGAPLVGDTRRSAEARVRVVAALTLLSAGTPMFLFGEEVGASRPFLYGQVLEQRQDLLGLRHSHGAALFRYYQALIRLRLDPARPALRSTQIEVVHSHDADRVLAFRRWLQLENYLVLASLNNQPFQSPAYSFASNRLGQENWREIFNSNSASFGGDDLGNGGAVQRGGDGRLACVLPANSVLVFERV